MTKAKSSGCICKKRLYAVIILAFITISVTACSTKIPQLTEDTAYLTPIPEATLMAFNNDGEITTKQQAAMFALRHRTTGHFGFTQLPKVISVEKLSTSEAEKRIQATGSVQDNPGWIGEVWFVVLEGEIRIIPPPPPSGVTATPCLSQHGCSYEVFSAISPGGYYLMGGYPCPKSNP